MNATLTFVLCPQSVTAALLSLRTVYPRRNLPAEQWRNAQLLSLLSLPAAMLDPAHCETVSHHYCISAKLSEEESVKLSLKTYPVSRSITDLKRTDLDVTIRFFKAHLQVSACVICNSVMTDKYSL